MDFEIFFSFLLRGLLQNEGKPTDRVERTVAVRLAGRRKKKDKLFVSPLLLCVSRKDRRPLFLVVFEEGGGGLRYFLSF